MNLRVRRKRNPPHLRWRVVSGRLRQFEVEQLEARVQREGIAKSEFIARAVRAALERAA